jgi:hypothetical protein
MRIMLINHYAGSPQMGMEYRPYYLAKEWLEMGHQVVIIASTNAHVRTHQPVVNESFTEEIINGIEYLWIKTPPYAGNGFGRVLNMKSFVNQLTKNAKKISQKYDPDLVIASSTYPLDNYPARKIANFSKAKYYYEVHDLWPLSPKELGNMSAFNPFILWMQKAENYAYKHADKVISMLPNTKEHMKSHGLNLDKWSYVPNGVNISEWNSNIKLNTVTQNEISSIRDSYNFLVAYTGSFGIANALDSFVKSANFIKNNKIALVLVGEGPEKQNLIELRNSLKLENVFFLEPIPKFEIPAILQNFDTLFIGLQRQPLFRFGISPNKLIDYMMASKPIIQAIDAGNNMVEEAQCGLNAEPENPESIANSILLMQNLELEKRCKMGENGKAFVTNYHNYKGLAQKFIEDI